MARRGRRRWKRAGLAVVALIGVAAAATPYWWPAMARLVPGVSIGDVDTHGWSTVELRDVRYEREGLRVIVAQARVPAFLWWPGANKQTSVHVTKVAIAPQPVPNRESPPASLRRVVGDILRAWPNLARWVPQTDIEELEIIPAAGGAPQVFRAVNWDGSRLSVEGTIPGRGDNVTATLARLDAETLHLTAVSQTMGATVDLRARAEPHELDATTALTWRSNTAQLDAVFGEIGFVPLRAKLSAPMLGIPATDLSIAGYGMILGSVHAEWTGSTYTATVNARAEPVEAKADRPPIAVDLQASGTIHEVRVQSALLKIPGVDATLSQPLVLALPGGAPAAPAEFKVDVDLAKLPRSPATGRITGNVQVTGGVGAQPAAQFSLTGTAIRWRDGEVSQLTANGRWSPAELQVEKLDVALAGESRIEGAATIDLAQKRIAQSRVTARVASAAVRPWVPKIPEFATVAIEATAEGDWTQPTHAGRMAWQEFAGMPGGAIDGEVSWTGEGIGKVAVEGQLISGGAITLPVSASITRNAEGAIDAELTKLAWHDAEGEWWHLAAPVSVRFGAGGLALGNVRLSGESIALSADADVRWPSSGRVNLSIANVVGARLGTLLPAAAHAAVLDTFDLRANWDRGPVELEGSMRASYMAEQTAGYYVQSEFRTESGDLALGAVRIYDGAGTVLEGEGRLPLHLAGREDGFVVQLPKDGELLLDLHSVPNPGFWQSVSNLTGWEIVDPALQVKLAGSLAVPRGQVILDATGLRPPAGLAQTVQLPRIGDVSIVADADADGVAVTRAYWTIDDHWVSLTGRAPWTLWRDSRESGKLPWRQAAFSFAADRMPLSIASRAVPRLFAPEGNVSFEMKHEPADGLSGFLWLDGVALRPIQPLGALRDIGGHMALEGYRLRLERLAAYLGGQSITITGETNIENLEHPVFAMDLESSRVPLVRQEGLVLRAALDLHVEQTADKPAHISGDVGLARSVFVSDLIGLLPTGGGVAAPEQRPPFFSVGHEPFSEWTVDVRLAGEDFLRIQNPFFRSEVSADFKLTGTLAEPRALGRAWTDEGTIIFPFGSLAVQQAEVLLTPEQPFEFALHAQASTRIYGYDVRLEVSGTAREPVLQFSSDPPLTSQQLFLMLSAGELPTEEHNFSTSERAQRLAMFVGRNLASTLGIGGGGEGEDRLEIRSGEDFSREGGETLYVQYNLDGRWAVVAEKDRFDAYNGGIKFRVIDR